MTEHIYPAFERGRIMKKELLWALRDYSYSALQLQYQNYTDGIISGCRIRVQDQHLIVEPGMVKCQDFIFLLTEEEKIRYAPTDVFVSLKFRLKSREILPDYVRYVTELVLDEKLDKAQGELELCRFKLKEGASLRTEYKDFYDIQTEFDTVNLADADWTGLGGRTLSKDITNCFAEKILECSGAADADIRFAYLLLQSKEAVPGRILNDYIARKTGRRRTGTGMEGKELFRELERILDEIRKGKNDRYTEQKEEDHRMIILD